MCSSSFFLHIIITFSHQTRKCPPTATTTSNWAVAMEEVDMDNLLHRLTLLVPGSPNGTSVKEGTSSSMSKLDSGATIFHERSTVVATTMEVMGLDRVGVTAVDRVEGMTIDSRKDMGDSKEAMVAAAAAGTGDRTTALHHHPKNSAKKRNLTV